MSSSPPVRLAAALGVAPERISAGLARLLENPHDESCSRAAFLGGRVLKALLSHRLVVASDTTNLEERAERYESDFMLAFFLARGTDFGHFVSSAHLAHSCKLLSTVMKAVLWNLLGTFDTYELWDPFVSAYANWVDEQLHHSMLSLLSDPVALETIVLRAQPAQGSISQYEQPSSTPRTDSVVINLAPLERMLLPVAPTTLPAAHSSLRDVTSDSLKPEPHTTGDFLPWSLFGLRSSESSGPKPLELSLNAHDWGNETAQYTTIFGKITTANWHGSQCVQCGAFRVCRKFSNKKTLRHVLGLEHCPGATRSWVAAYQSTAQQQHDADAWPRILREELESWGFLPAPSRKLVPPNDFSPPGLSSPPPPPPSAFDFKVSSESDWSGRQPSVPLLSRAHDWGKEATQNTTIFGKITTANWHGSQCVQCGAFRVCRKFSNKKTLRHVLGLEHCPGATRSWVAAYQSTAQQQHDADAWPRILREELESWGFLPGRASQESYTERLGKSNVERS